MPLTATDIEQAATALFEAERDGTQTGLLSIAHPDMTMDEAYAVQRALVDRKLATGRTVTGWKIGLTSKAMQDALKIDIPDSGILFDDMHFDSGATVPRDRYIQPRIEAEIAFIMNKDLGGEVTRETVIDATRAIAPALEILDTRILRNDPKSGATRTIVDTISDNAANAGIVLGDARHDPKDIDMRWVGAIVMKNGDVEETGLGAGVLNDPVEGIVWLCRRLHEYGRTIRAGDVVLSGSFIRPLEARSGDKFDADYGPFGRVQIAFD